ncbi:MAG: 16S rRNA (adenine(1518)-N(6)/adenine(1519)-N(6))-dimethyltransferase [Actinobacteria bacterium]|nr:16S rRNA (adenine(1518)-N(6)/adenine(1519)-N(6))-dimethyltransferase [Actinomycetota bacterium]
MTRTVLGDTPWSSSVCFNLCASRTSISIAVTRLLAWQSAKVKEPKPGPTSTTWSCSLIHDDALHVTSIENEPNKLVANLPYNVSVPVFLNFLERFPSIISGVIMVQTEVAERLVAAPGSKTYGVPSAKAAWYCDLALVDSVSRSVFWPVPNVDSSLVKFTRHDPIGDEKLRRTTFDLIDRAFGQRRKMLRAIFSEMYGGSIEAERALASAGVDPTARGESLSISRFAAIARQLDRR